MKNLKTMLADTILVILSGTVMATGNLKVNITPGEKEKALVQISNLEKSRYEIELENENGEIVFLKKADAPAANYSKSYDFSMLEDGEYNLAVKTSNEKEVHTLKIENGSVELLKMQKEVEPFFTMKGDRLELSYLNFGNENVKFLVYDNATQELLFEKVLGPDFAINYGVDFSSLGSGKYDAVLSGEDNFYEYTVAIK